SYPALPAALTAGPHAVAAAGLIAVLAGLMFKTGAVPAQFWVPDVTEGTSTPVAAFVTTIPKIGALAALARLLTVAIPVTVMDWPLLIAVLAAATMTLGNLGAFFQTSAKRLLAYSTISQAGYLLIPVAVAPRTHLAITSLLFYLAAYAVTNLGAFAVVAEFPQAAALSDYAGMARRHPGMAAVLVVCLLGLVGTPPTAVFLGKLEVFTAAIDGGYAWLAALAVANTIASLFYYLRWLTPAFLSAPAPPAARPRSLPTPRAAPPSPSASPAVPSSPSSPATPLPDPRLLAAGGQRLASRLGRYSLLPGQGGRLGAVVSHVEQLADDVCAVEGIGVGDEAGQAAENLCGEVARQRGPGTQNDRGEPGLVRAGAVTEQAGEPWPGADGLRPRGTAGVGGLGLDRGGIGTQRYFEATSCWGGRGSRPGLVA